MRRITDGLSMSAISSSRSPQRGHARTSNPKLRRINSAHSHARAENAAPVLQAAGIDTAVYHGGMADAARTRVQDRFASGAVQVVCATNAFGMGIDRPDIDVVIHADLPGSIEAYYQEIGRAGRGRPSGDR